MTVPSADITTWRAPASGGRPETSTLTLTTVPRVPDVEVRVDPSLALGTADVPRGEEGDPVATETDARSIGIEERVDAGAHECRGVAVEVPHEHAELPDRDPGTRSPDVDWKTTTRPFPLRACGTTAEDRRRAAHRTRHQFRGARHVVVHVQLTRPPDGVGEGEQRVAAVDADVVGGGLSGGATGTLAARSTRAPVVVSVRKAPVLARLPLEAVTATYRPGPSAWSAVTIHAALGTNPRVRRVVLVPTVSTTTAAESVSA